MSRQKRKAKKRKEKRTKAAKLAPKMKTSIAAKNILPAGDYTWPDFSFEGGLEK